MTAPWIVAILLLWAMVVLVAFVVLGVLRRISGVLEGAEIRLRSSPMSTLTGGLEIGEKVPAFSLRDASDRSIRSDAVVADGAVFVFMERECEPCQALAARLVESEPRRFDHDVVIVLDEADRGSWDLGRAVSPMYQRSHEASEAFRNNATPVGFAVDSMGLIVARSITNTAAAIDELVRSLDRDKAG